MGVAAAHLAARLRHSKASAGRPRDVPVIDLKVAGLLEIFSAIVQFWLISPAIQPMRYVAVRVARYVQTGRVLSALGDAGKSLQR